eukprot:m51a1_g6827 hypothetical protein (171) ;mRNA; f:35496-36567
MRALVIASIACLCFVCCSAAEQRFSIQSRSSGMYLDGRAPGMTQLVLTDRPPHDDLYLQWTLVPVTDGRFAIKSCSSGGFLDGRAAGMHTPVITFRELTPNDFCLQWSLVPVSHESDVALLSRSSGGYLDGPTLCGDFSGCSWSYYLAKDLEETRREIDLLSRLRSSSIA